jgi:signal transduction histidine kinase
MTQISFVTQSEREIYRMYERERRLRILRYATPAMTGVMILLLGTLLIPQTKVSSQSLVSNPYTSISSLLTSSDPTKGIIFLSINILGIALFAVSSYAAWKGYANTGAILATLAFINTVAYVTISAMSIGIQDIRVLMTQTALIGIAVLAFVTLVGELWSIIATTIVLSTLLVIIRLAVAFYLLRPVFLTDNPDFLNQALLEDIVILFGAGLILFFAALTYRQNLRTLGDVRVQYERASQLDELKDQFISSVNHELRNPVMLMHGYIDLLCMVGDKLPKNEIMALAKRANDAGDSLIELIESILDVRRLDQGADDFEPVELSVQETIKEASSLVNMRKENFTTRELRIRSAEGLFVWGEKVRFRQILTNLLTNAVKYSPDGTPVEITARIVVESAQKKDNPLRRQYMVEIAVRDYGLGIPPDQIPLLFQRFVRLKRDLASTVVGNGLGLYLCRVYAEAMHGRIWVESTGVEGEGSTFYLRLPTPPNAQTVIASDEKVAQAAIS